MGGGKQWRPILSMLKFPDGFLWGAATSAYQVEGGNIRSDWWKWEEAGMLKYKCGHACRHYELFSNDFDLAKSLNHNAHRLSIEWSRIEPAEGEFSRGALKHYIDVIDALKERGIEPIVTLHHFTNPSWFTKKGGWARKDAPGYFLRYTEKIVEELCGKVRFWVTINEPLVYVYHSYVIGLWPPQERGFSNFKKVRRNFTAAHIKAYGLIHAIYERKGLRPPDVSIAHNVQFFDRYSDSLRNRIAVVLRDRVYNFGIIDELARAGTLDFIGLNYYTRRSADVRSWGMSHMLIDTPRETGSSVKKNSLGWDIYPQGLYDLCLRFNKHGLPLFILENGICTSDDDMRWDYIKEHLKAIHAAMGSGVRLLGYLYWSLLDNYEWHNGFAPRFGLIEVDYSSYKRTVRKSAENFAGVSRDNAVSEEML